MAHGTGTTHSVWMKTAEHPHGEPPPPATEILACDVCVIGAGMAGMTAAYLLAREGKNVIVLSDQQVGEGETGRTTAHLSNAIDDRYEYLISVRGEQAARMGAEAHGAAIDSIEAWSREEGVDCDFQRLDGWLFPAKPEHAPRIRSEADAARRAGIAGVAVEAPPLGFMGSEALRFPRQARFHPLKFMTGLAEAFRKRGGRIFGNARAVEVKGGRRASVETREGLRVDAEAVIVATNSPFIDRFEMHTKLAPYRTYAISTAVPKGSVPDALYWDTLETYHYVRLQPGDGHDELIVGGEDHKTGQDEHPEDRWRKLETWARERFPQIGEVTSRWSGQVLETLDGLAYIGRNPLDEKNVFIATGDSGMGMTHGAIAGMLLTDLVLKRPNAWERAFDPSRQPVGAARDWIEENLNVAKQYADYVTGGDVTTEDAIPPGSGATLRDGATKLAVYRDTDGTLHRMSAVCPHLGCIVRWNSAEKSWDCPCHGSRYDAKGELLNGPAARGLERR